MKTLVLVLAAAFMISCYGDSFNSEILQRRKLVKQKCKQPIDLAIILDSSNSISYISWDKVKAFAKSLVESLGDVSKAGSHVAVMRFSTKAEIDLSFKTFESDKFNAQNVKEVIDNLKQMKEETFLDRALLLANEGIFTTNAGMRGDEKIKKVVVIMTDGMQTVGGGPYTPLYDASETLRKKNIEIYTIGVGPSISLQQLVDVATSPDYVYSVPGFDSLLKEVEKMRLVTCDCYEPLDIGIILDGSTSIVQRGNDNFDDAKDVIVSLLKQLHVGKGDDKSHFGLIMYSDVAKTKVERRLNDSQDFATAAREIKAIRLRGGSTYTSNALKLAGETFFHPGYNGNRKLKNIKSIAIVFTDGASNDGYDGTSMAYIKDIPIIAVGIGSELKMDDLKKVARNNESMTVQASDFSELKKKLNEIVQLTC